MEIEVNVFFDREHKGITTKEEIVKLIEKRVESIRAGEGSEAHKTVKSHLAFLEFSERFLERVKEIHLPEIVTEGWELQFYITETSAALYLQLVSVNKKVKKEGYSFSILESFDLVEVRPKMLTVEDYAALHDVSVITVRQWIRRGKLRDAEKIGSEWRIPEFVEPYTGKYLDGLFTWHEKLQNLPPEYDFLNDYRSIATTQFDKDAYKVAFIGKDAKDNKLLILNTKEREKLELWLISNPFVKCHDGGIDFEVFEEML